MSIQTEITRIQSARNTLRAKATELKISAGTERLDELAADFDGILNQGSVSAQVKEGETYTIPKGYHDGTGTVSGVAGGGSYTLQSKTVTPTKKPQQVTPDEGYYGLSDLTVQAIPEAYQDVTAVTAAEADVLAGKVFVDSTGTVRTGTMPNIGTVSKTLDASAPSYTIPQGCHGGSGTVSILPETKTVTPTKAEQTVQPTIGKVLTAVTVDPIPDDYIITADADAAAADLLAGKTAYAGGSKITGTMPDNGPMDATLDGLTVTAKVIPAGYTAGGTVALDGTIEEALAAI